MTEQEQLKALLIGLMNEQGSVTTMMLNAETATGPIDRADLFTAMRWAQGRRDAIRDHVLAEFARVTAQRDEALAAIEGALESHERRLELNTSQLRAVLAKAKEGS